MNIFNTARIRITELYEDSITFLKQSYGLIILNLISIISLLNFKKWFQVIYRQMSKKKYTNLEGFRR